MVSADPGRSTKIAPEDRAGALQYILAILISGQRASVEWALFSCAPSRCLPVVRNDSAVIYCRSVPENDGRSGLSIVFVVPSNDANTSHVRKLVRDMEQMHQAE